MLLLKNKCVLKGHYWILKRTKKTLNKTINPHQAKRIIKLYNTYIFNVNELISPTNTKSTILAT